MSVFRVNRSKDYTVMSNYHFKDKRLSLKAKGLLSQMLSLPDEWDYSMNGLASINKENVSAIKTALKELKECGYLIITKKMSKETVSGRIEYIYDIFEQPRVKQEGKKQEVEILPLENLPLEFQPLENHRQLNTNNKKLKDKLNNNLSIYNSEFAKIWEKYPKKQGKEKALEAYIIARENGVEYDTILNGVERYSEYCKTIDNKYIKLGSNWFSGSCWKDDYAKSQPVRYNGFGEVVKEASYDINELMRIK